MVELFWKEILPIRICNVVHFPIKIRESTIEEHSISIDQVCTMNSLFLDVDAFLHIVAKKYFEWTVLNLNKFHSHHLHFIRAHLRVEQVKNRHATQPTTAALILKYTHSNVRYTSSRSMIDINNHLWNVYFLPRRSVLMEELSSVLIEQFRIFVYLFS